MGSWPNDVGILALEIIFPSQYVDQTELEAFDGVSAGKYTIGLGQLKMGFCTDREDINSMCLTVVKRLLEKNNIAYSSIGHLGVGTETLIDKSKSVKSVLMQLFEPHGVTDLEGVDSINACYGGTAALFNAISWVESSAWNGRYALVVAGDIAVYSKGPARPTGGAGAVAMLVGPDAPLVFDRGTRGSYMKHAYDFYKPHMDSTYPVVDGKLSVQCYLEALDNAYQMYCKNVEKRSNCSIDLDHFDSVLFHAPYGKLVQKSLARLVLNDFLRASESTRNQKYDDLKSLSNVVLKDSYFDRDTEKSLLAHSKICYEKKTVPSLLLSSQIGNMYTSSLYGGLVSLLVNKDVSELVGTRIGLFSYGSGLAASFYSITVSKSNESVTNLVKNLKDIKTRLQKRHKVSPEKFEATLELKQERRNIVPYEPSASIDDLLPGTYYLSKIDELCRRSYERVPVLTNGHVE